MLNFIHIINYKVLFNIQFKKSKSSSKSSFFSGSCFLLLSIGFLSKSKGLLSLSSLSPLFDSLRIDLLEFKGLDSFDSVLDTLFFKVVVFFVFFSNFFYVKIYIICIYFSQFLLFLFFFSSFLFNSNL